MSIVKRVPDNIGFTMVSNQVLQHETMSLTARGLLTHLLSMPPDWKINVNHLLGQFQESRPRVSRAWQELKELGYVRKIQLREKGRIAGWDYEVSQDIEKQEASISTTLKNKNLASNNLDSNNLATEVHKKKEEIKQTKNKETEDNPLTPRGGNQTAAPLVDDLKPEEKKRKPRVGNLDLPSWLSREIWEDFVEHRKALRKPMTPKAGELILKKLQSIAADHGEQAAQESLLNSIAAGWQGVFPPKGSTSAGAQEDELDRMFREAERLDQLQRERLCTTQSFAN